MASYHDFDCERDPSSDTTTVVDDDDVALLLHDTKSEHRKHKSRFRPEIYKFAIICFAAWGYFSLCLQLSDWIHPSPSTAGVPGASRNNYCDCGNTIEEAKAKGCIFDALATAWLPPECRDDELTAEFNRSGPGIDGAWPYWAEKNGTTPLTTADLAAMGGKMVWWWSTREWHVYHCDYYWRKELRLRTSGSLMEDRYSGIKHPGHCMDVFLDERPLDAITVKARVLLTSKLWEENTEMPIAD